MNKRDNPYTPRSGSAPPTLAGCDGQIEMFGNLLARLEKGSASRSIICTGLHGVGKTALLTEFDTLASEAGWVTTDVFEVIKGSDARIILERVVARLGPMVRRRLGTGIDVELSNTGELQHDLPRLLVTVGELARDAKSGVLLVIDEMQRLNKESLAAICVAFQALGPAGLPVALTGAGSPDLPARLLAAKPYAGGLFEYVELGALEDPDARTALIGPAARADFGFTDEALDQIVEETGGYPTLLQAYGWELWNYAESSPITAADLDGVRPLAQDRLNRNFFVLNFDRATPSEQRYLVAMAMLGDGPYAVGEVAQEVGVSDQRQVSMQRDALKEKDLICSPGRGQVDFTVPLFAEFLRNSA